MEFFRKGKNQNYDLWSGYSWYVPGVAGMFAMLGWLLLGSVLGNVLSAILLLLPGMSGLSEYIMLIAYPVMFIPAMLYARFRSNRDMMFEKGVAMDSSNFGRAGGLLAAGAAMLATVALAFNMDAVNRLMPPMPGWLETALNSMVQGRFWVNFLSVSIFAPLFEEWLCRGIVLRGLLNAVRPDGSSVRPAWAIAASALFFAVIHMNPWQAIPAFALGCLFGYVYYRTGSLKLVMLMHFTNNTLTLLVSQCDALKDAQTWLDVLPAQLYWILFAAFCALLVLIVRMFARIPLSSPKGNCDVVEEL